MPVNAYSGGDLGGVASVAGGLLSPCVFFSFSSSLFISLSVPNPSSAVQADMFCRILFEAEKREML